MLEQVISAAALNRADTIFYKSAQLLAYADDFEIIGENNRYVCSALSTLEVSPVIRQTLRTKSHSISVSSLPAAIISKKKTSSFIYESALTPLMVAALTSNGEALLPRSASLSVL